MTAALRQGEPRRRKSSIRRKDVRSVRRARPRREDQEFLPADLQILESPPSPVRMALILLIGALVVVALVWSWFGRIDVVASAQGKIQPTGRVKVIQPFDTGKVAAIMVENGRNVRAGDVLIEIDHAEASADEEGATAALDSFRAEALRRRAAIAAAISTQFQTVPVVDWTGGEISPAARRRQEQVMKGDLVQLATTLASLDAQKHQKQVERDQLDKTIKAQQELLVTLTERVTMRETLFKSTSGSRASVIDATETLQAQRTVLTTQVNQREAANANIIVFDRERDKVLAGFIADNGVRLAEAERRIDELTQQQVKARLRLARSTLISPIDGTVQGLTVTTVGQVVTTAQEIMRVVPEDATLEVEAYLANRDVGFVKLGQIAVLKIEAFPFTRYGTIRAEVMRVGQDAIPEPEAQQAETNGLQPARNGAFTGAQRLQNLVFPLTLKLLDTKIGVDGQEIALRPGMAVRVEIATGGRRILDFFLSPLMEVSSEAIRER